MSELGDKTFFIAAILAMRHSRLLVFGGAISALGLMTVLSGNYPICHLNVCHIVPRGSIIQIKSSMDQFSNLFIYVNHRYRY